MRTFGGQATGWQAVRQDWHCPLKGSQKTNDGTFILSSAAKSHAGAWQYPDVRNGFVLIFAHWEESEHEVPDSRFKRGINEVYTLVVFCRKASQNQ